MSTLFGYFGIGLRALTAALVGIDIAGNNIANVNTPGFARRRLLLEPGTPLRVDGLLLDQGVDVAAIRRVQDRFLQATLEREQGGLANSGERLRGLQDVESAFGTLDGEGLPSAYGAFSEAFSALASGAEDLGLRRAAVDSAEALAARFRDTYARLSTQREAENRRVGQLVEDVNRLGAQLEQLNTQIRAEEADGTEAAALRDTRTQVIEQLASLTGGHAVPSDDGGVGFALAGGPTLVTSARALPLTAVPNGSGMLRLFGTGGADVSDLIRTGELGAVLELRDGEIAGRLSDLDQLATDLITRANALTRLGTDLNGAAGGALFEPDPAPASGAARSIRVATDVAADPARLAISTAGPGDGTIAVELSNLQDLSSATLGWRSPADFIADMTTALGDRVVAADVAAGVSRDVVDTLTRRRDAISGISLDEEAVQLIRNQRAYQAAAQFISVINDITEIAVNLR